MITLAKKGFSLVELLTVLAIIAILSALLASNFGSLLSSNNFDAAINGISLTLTQARAYALARHTYVYVGLEEADATKASVPAAQTSVASPTVGGRVLMAAVASTDGTSGYSIYAPTAPAASSLVQIQKLAVFNNVHLADLSTVTTGNIATRPTAGYQISDGTASMITFNLPLGAATPQCTFNMVIQFDPRGTAAVITTAGPLELTGLMEIGLEPTYGKALPAKTPNLAAIQLEATTGEVQIYRQ